MPNKEEAPKEEIRKAVVEFQGKKFNVEGTPAQIEDAVKQITGFQDSAPAEQVNPATQNLGQNIMTQGPNALAQTLTPGAGPEDVVGLLSALVQGMTSRVATNTTQRPVLTAVGGPSSAQMTAGANIPGNLMNQLNGTQNKEMFPAETKTLNDLPTPKTEAGKKLATPIELLGGLVGPGQTTVRAINKIGKVISEANEAKDIKFAGRVRDAFFELPRKFSQEFGSQLDELEKSNPAQPIDISQEVGDLLDEMRKNGDLARRVAIGVKKFGDKEVAAIMDKFSKGGTQGVAGASMPELTLTMTQKVLRALKKAPGLEGKLNRAGSSFDVNEVPILMAISDIREKQLAAFPQFAKALEGYAENISKFKQTRNLFKFGQTIGRLKGSFGDPEMETAVMALLPKNIVKEIGGVREAVRFAKMGKEAGAWAGKAAGVAGLAGVGSWAWRNLVK